MADATAELERASADIPINKDARDVLERATALASERGAAQAAPTDVLEAITADRGSSAFQAIKTLAGDPKAIDPHAAGVDGAQPGAARPARPGDLSVEGDDGAEIRRHPGPQLEDLRCAVLDDRSPSRATRQGKHGHRHRTADQRGARCHSRGAGRLRFGTTSPRERRRRTRRSWRFL